MYILVEGSRRDSWILFDIFMDLITCPYTSENDTSSITTSTQPDNYDKYLLDQKFNRAEALELSRSWLPAPWKPQVITRIFQKLPVFTRRIAPPFWTGKNFKKR